MAKPGRNEPCHCQSGKKYKHCCIDKDAAAVSAHLALEAEGRRLMFQHLGSEPDDDHVCDDCAQLHEAADAVFELVEAKKLDEAERAALAIARDYPDAIDGPDCLAIIAEERADRAAAAGYYREALKRLEAVADPHGHDDNAKRWYRHKITALGPPSATTPLPEP